VAGKTRAYPKEFREDAVRLYRSSGKSLAPLSRELSIAVESLRTWIEQIELRQRSSERRPEERGGRGPAAAPPGAHPSTCV
jgi:transposase